MPTDPESDDAFPAVERDPDTLILNGYVTEAHEDLGDLAGPMSAYGMAGWQ